MSTPDPVPQPPLFKKPELIPGWQRCYKWFSTQSMSTAIGVQGIYAMLDDRQKVLIGHGTIIAVTITVLVLGLLGNIIKQNFKE